MVDNNTKEMGLPNVLELHGEAARIFEEYDKRPLTKKEKQILEEADEFYRTMCAKNK